MATTSSQRRREKASLDLVGAMWAIRQMEQDILGDAILEFAEATQMPEPEIGFGTYRCVQCPHEVGCGTACDKT